MFDPHTLTNMQPITNKPKIPTPELCTADTKWSEANKFDTWPIDVLDYLMVHHIRPGPVSQPPRGGPWELLVVAAGVPDANRDRWMRRRLQVCLVPFSGSSWVVNT